MKKLNDYFKNLEKNLRFHLSRHPVVYGLLAGFFFVIFWKGVEDLVSSPPNIEKGLILIIVSIPVLLVSGVFVSFFVTEKTFISGLKKEEQIEKKTETEVHQEENLLKTVAEKVDEIEKEMKKIEEEVEKK